MKPKIETTAFGSITVEGETYTHDILIHLSGKIKKRDKEIAKRRYGTSHVIGEEEAEKIFEKGCERVIIGTGQYGRVELDEDARRYFEEHNVKCILEPTPEAIQTWNDTRRPKVGLFHVTC